jgi:ERCC4-related helicase
MTSTGSTLSHLRMLPHQISLVDTVLNPESKRVTLLSAEVGLGKTTALVALSKRLLQEHPTARVLVLTPRALQLQFAERLYKESTTTLMVDRYRFRALLDEASGEDIWPRGAVILLSMDFARQPDINDSLTKARWELVIVDEVPISGDVRVEALRRISASADHIVLTMPAVPNFETLDTVTSEQLLSERAWLKTFSTLFFESSLIFPDQDIAVIDWRRNKLVDHSGKLLDTAPRPRIVEISYKLEPEELNLRKMVTDLCQVSEFNLGSRSWIKTSLLRHVESSPPAIESFLRKLSERSLAERKLGQSSEAPDDESSDEQEISGVFPEETLETVEKVLQYIDQLSTDSKLEMLGKFLHHRLSKTGTSARVAIVADYLATLFYLAAEMESRNIKFALIHGGMSSEDREKLLMSLADAETVLLTTRGAIPDNIALAQTTDVLLYDIPSNELALQKSLRRFDRFGRKSQLTIHVLVPSNSPDAPMFEALGVLRDVARRHI